jgi:four helix bundle protein
MSHLPKSPNIARSFRDLRVYQSAFAIAADIHQLTKGFPNEEKYSLTDQMRRSSRSVCANIAEAWRKRRYPKSFVSKLSDADGEACETQVWLDLSLHFGYIQPEFHDQLVKQCDHIGAQLSLMMDEPEKWARKTAGSSDRRT